MRKIMVLFCLVFAAAVVCSCGTEGEENLKITKTGAAITIATHFSNIYLIETKTGYILVDTGMDTGGKLLDPLFAQLGIDPKEIELIIITHAHSDHMGATAYAKNLTGAKVLCHKYAASFLEYGKSEPTVARNTLGKLLNTLQPAETVQVPGVKPDITVDKTYDLGEFGIDGKVIHTPGHSSGSISIVLDSGDIMVGDMVRGKPDKLTLGMFYEDKDVLLTSIEKIISLNPRVIHLSHGTVTDSKTLQNFLKFLKK